MLMPCPCIGPKLFWTNQIVLDEYKSFWQVQIRLFRTNFYNLDLSKIIRPKQLVLNRKRFQRFFGLYAAL